MSGRKCFFFDFDNTLFSHRTKRVPESAKKVLKEIRSLGHVVVLATGRGQESLEFINEACDFSFDAMIMMNGQQVYIGNEMVFEQHISVSLDDEIISIAEKNGIAYGGWCEHGLAVNNLNQRVRKVYSDFESDSLPLEISDFVSVKAIYMLLLFITKDEEQLFPNIGNDFIPNRSHDYLLNLLPRSAGKSIGMELICRHFGIEKGNTVAFGDGYNDMDMLSSAEMSVAMEDGSEELKKVASFISPPAHEDGIALTFERMLNMDTL